MQSVAFRPLCVFRRKEPPPSRRSVSDAQLKAGIKRVYDDNFKAYGPEKIWRQLQREGIACGRDRVARLMRRARHRWRDPGQATSHLQFPPTRQHAPLTS